MAWLQSFSIGEWITILTLISSAIAALWRYSIKARDLTQTLATVKADLLALRADLKEFEQRTGDVSMFRKDFDAHMAEAAPLTQRFMTLEALFEEEKRRTEEIVRTAQESRLETREELRDLGKKIDALLNRLLNGRAS